MIPNWVLTIRQSLPLECKVAMSLYRIRQWNDMNAGKVYVSFSGGKDSTVLLDLVRQVNPLAPAVFADTGLEYPEIKSFVRSKDNVVVIRPKMGFREVLKKYGYPVGTKEIAQGVYEARRSKSVKLICKRLFGDNNKRKSGKIPDQWRHLLTAPFKVSHLCCDVMKKRPFKQYEKESGRVPFVGTMASDSQFRKQSWAKYGCNAFDIVRPRSMPLAFWTEKDIWDYISRNDLPYASVYDQGQENTGCVFCTFGVQYEPAGDNKFCRLAKSHPKLWRYCMEDLGIGEVLDYLGIKRK